MGKLISELDEQRLHMMWKDYESRVQGTTNRPTTDWFDQDFAPETYIILTPPGGIPALTDINIGTGSGTGTGTMPDGPSINDQPGYALCHVYQILHNSDSTPPKLVSTSKDLQYVYNLSGAPVFGKKWTTVKRDKYGSWIVDEPSGTSQCPTGDITFVTNVCLLGGLLSVEYMTYDFDNCIMVKQWCQVSPTDCCGPVISPCACAYNVPRTLWLTILQPGTPFISGDEGITNLPGCGVGVCFPLHYIEGSDIGPDLANAIGLPSQHLEHAWVSQGALLEPNAGEYLPAELYDNCLGQIPVKGINNVPVYVRAILFCTSYRDEHGDLVSCSWRLFYYYYAAYVEFQNLNLNGSAFYSMEVTNASPFMMRDSADPAVIISELGCISPTGTGTGTGTNLESTVSCCPGVTIPSTLYGHFTDGTTGCACLSSGGGVFLTFTYTSASGGYWYSNVVDCGGEDIQFILSCDGTDTCFGFHLGVFCNAVLIKSVTLTGCVCDPFELSYNFGANFTPGEVLCGTCTADSPMIFFLSTAHP